MPEIISLLPTLAACVLLCLGIDCYTATRKPEIAAESSNANKGRLSDFVLFTPFAALIYSDEFWSNLLATLPLLLLTLTAQAICYKKRWLKVAPEPWPFIFGPYMLAVLGYFMFFREGILVESAPATPTVDNAPDEDRSHWVSFWPYAVYLASFVLTMTRKRLDGISLSLLFFVLVITIVPFFTDHYWWFMAGGFILLLLAVYRMFRVLESRDCGAVSLISGYFYMLMAFGSTVVYAILF